MAPELTYDNLWPVIQRINEALQQGEPGNISQDTHSGYLGYDPQSIYDAVNQFIGPENWRYDLIELRPVEGKDRMFEAQICVSLRVNGEWVPKGIQFGGGIGSKDATDGKKAAVTDGIKKAFSAWSIGNRAYLGLLTLDGNTKQALPPQQKRQGPAWNPPADGQITKQQVWELVNELGWMGTKDGKPMPEQPFWALIKKNNIPNAYSKWTQEEIESVYGLLVRERSSRAA